MRTLKTVNFSSVNSSLASAIRVIEGNSRRIPLQLSGVGLSTSWSALNPGMASLEDANLPGRTRLMSLMLKPRRPSWFRLLPASFASAGGNSLNFDSYEERPMRRAAKPIGGSTVRFLVILFLAFLSNGAPAFAQAGGDRVSQFMANALSYGQSLGIYAAGFLVIWAVANVARERPSAKQWIGAGAALLLSSILQLLQSF
jgi:hypothetical protein